jgi:hypothetical protein
LGEDLPKLWGAASAVERKHILRLVMKEDIWQTVITWRRAAEGKPAQQGARGIAANHD